MINKKLIGKSLAVIFIVCLGVVYYFLLKSKSDLSKQEYKNTNVATNVVNTPNQFVLKKDQSLKDFFLRSAPEGEHVVAHYTKEQIILHGRRLFVVVYDNTYNEVDDREEATGNDSSLYQPSVYAFIQKENNKEVYIRVLVTYLDVDGGIATKVEDIFTENFSTSTESEQLGLLTMWDSTRAGGHSVMETSGLLYKVLAFNLDTDITFSPFTSSLVSKLDDCECTTFIRGGTVHDGETVSTSTSKIKNVAEVKREILNMKNSTTTR